MNWFGGWGIAHKLADGLRSGRENWGQTGESLELHVERVRVNWEALGGHGEKQRIPRAENNLRNQCFSTGYPGKVIC